MKEAIATATQTYLQQAASLLLYQATLQGDVGVAFLALLQAIHQAAITEETGSDLALVYGNWFRAIAAANQTWQDYLLTRLLWDENPFTQQVQQTELQNLPSALVAAARYDLNRLQQLAECDGKQLSQWVQELTGTALVTWDGDEASTLAKLKTSLQPLTSWADGLESLAHNYRQQGTGIFAQFHALRWQQGQLVGIATPDRGRLADLVGYEIQKTALLRNTEFLLNGYPALHVLLYGSRGSGKSSLVKGLLQATGTASELPFYQRGLRLIEVAKSDLRELPAIVEPLRNLALKFIIFVDDLSFEAEEDAYKALKVVLEGNLSARPPNAVVYATSNRRHLIREFFGDRPRPSDADEIHAWDTMQEKLSFSDRFGLTLTFEPADQKTYLQIVQHLASQAHLSLPPKELEQRALQWATRHNGRSGRTARQFVDFLKAELALTDDIS
jgi:hypothetical protein